MFESKNLWRDRAFLQIRRKTGTEKGNGLFLRIKALGDHVQIRHQRNWTTGNEQGQI